VMSEVTQQKSIILRYVLKQEGSAEEGVPVLGA